jgi:phosphoglycolate phosphatase-like HAD superfamily hydrolase
VNPASANRLALFDIDGTLVSSNGIAKKVFTEALEITFGRVTTAHKHDFAGRTDMQIYHEIAAASGIDESESESRIGSFFDTFRKLLADRLHVGHMTVYPGVKSVLEGLRKNPSCTLGLLTGNTAPTAEIKLSIVDLWRYFQFGAFGGERRRRDELPELAVERAQQLTGLRFTNKEIVIIGDTPHDIACGRHLGVKTVAVATGTFGMDALSEHCPDHLFKDFSEAAHVIKAIMD